VQQQETKKETFLNLSSYQTMSQQLTKEELSRFNYLYYNFADVKGNITLLEEWVSLFLKFQASKGK